MSKISTIFEDEYFPAKTREPCPNPYEGFLPPLIVTSVDVISLSQEVSPFQTKSLSILMVSIPFFPPVETRKKPLPQHSTFPGFHCEVSISLKYTG